MLLANNTVAKKILDSFPDSACLRRHPIPDPKRFESIIAALESKELSLDLTTNKVSSRKVWFHYSHSF